MPGEGTFRMLRVGGRKAAVSIVKELVLSMLNRSDARSNWFDPGEEWVDLFIFPVAGNIANTQHYPALFSSDLSDLALPWWSKTLRLPLR